MSIREVADAIISALFEKLMSERTPDQTLEGALEEIIKKESDLR
jgi:hypothetical protein